MSLCATGYGGSIDIDLNTNRINKRGEQQCPPLSFQFFFLDYLEVVSEADFQAKFRVIAEV